MTKEEAQNIIAQGRGDNVSLNFTTHGFIGALEALGILKFEEFDVPEHHREHDVYVKARAANNADAPYDQDTCKRYPWAAAARITYLEQQLLQIRKLVK